MKYPVNVSVYVPSAAVWSIPFRRVLWFIFLNKLTLAKKTQTCERPTILDFLWYVETARRMCRDSQHDTLAPRGGSLLPPPTVACLRPVFLESGLSLSLSAAHAMRRGPRALSHSIGAHRRVARGGNTKRVTQPCTRLLALSSSESDALTL